MSDTIQDGKFVELTYRVTDRKTRHVLTRVDFPLGYVHGRNEVLAPMVHMELEGKCAGDVIEVPTVDGLAEMTIPAGTQSGKVIRMRDKGVPYLRSDRRGDQLVIINTEIPKRLTAQQRELMEQLAESLGTEVKPQERSILDSVRDFFMG